MGYTAIYGNIAYMVDVEFSLELKRLNLNNLAIPHVKYAHMCVHAYGDMVCIGELSNLF